MVGPHRLARPAVALRCQASAGAEARELGPRRRLCLRSVRRAVARRRQACKGARLTAARARLNSRSEEHTSELQSLRHLVCRLLLEKKKKKPFSIIHIIKKKKNTNNTK